MGGAGYGRKGGAGYKMREGQDMGGGSGRVWE